MHRNSTDMRVGGIINGPDGSSIKGRDYASYGVVMAKYARDGSHKLQYPFL
jgi:hypothetical protein